MALTKEQKQKIISELEEKIKEQKAIVFIDFSGIKTKDIFEMRKNLKEAGSQLIVAKKTLAEIAFKQSGLKAEIRKLEGEVGLKTKFIRQKWFGSHQRKTAS